MDPLRSKKHAVESRVRSANKSGRRSGLARSSEENEEEMQQTFLVIKTRTRHLNSDRERKEKRKGKKWREASSNYFTDQAWWYSFLSCWILTNIDASVDAPFVSRFLFFSIFFFFFFLFSSSYACVELSYRHSLTRGEKTAGSSNLFLLRGAGLAHRKEDGWSSKRIEINSSTSVFCRPQFEILRCK